jgi:hypothetical protein
MRVHDGNHPGPTVARRVKPQKPRLRDSASKDRLRITPAAKKVLEEASKPNRRRLQVAAQQVLAQIPTRQPPDPAAVLLDALDVNTSEVRRRLDLPSEVRQETHSDAAVPSKGRAWWSSVTPPTGA